MTTVAIHRHRADVRAEEALVEVTYMGHHGELPSPVPLDASDADILRWITESIHAGNVVGVGQHADADFRSYVVQRFTPTADRPFTLIMVRPKTTFGVGLMPPAA